MIKRPNFSLLRCSDLDRFCIRKPMFLGIIPSTSSASTANHCRILSGDRRFFVAICCVAVHAPKIEDVVSASKELPNFAAMSSSESPTLLKYPVHASFITLASALLIAGPVTKALLGNSSDCIPWFSVLIVLSVSRSLYPLGPMFLSISTCVGFVTTCLVNSSSHMASMRFICVLAIGVQTSCTPACCRLLAYLFTASAIPFCCGVVKAIVPAEYFALAYVSVSTVSKLNKFCSALYILAVLLSTGASNVDILCPMRHMFSAP